jgi:branched-chain amino acid transport system permease protein
MKRKDSYALLVMAILIAIFPWIVAGNEYFISILVFLGINSIITMGLCLLMGYAGQISLGHAAFYGIGAYSSGILTTHYSFSPVMAFFLGIFFSALVAYLVGKPTLRLKGHYMAVATLGFGEIFFIVFNELASWTGGPSGLSGIPALRFFGKTLEETAYLYLVWSFVIIILIFSLNMVNSRVGRALRAVHGSELAANAMGVDAARYKVQVFVLSAVYASMAGSLYAHFVTFISPSSFGLMPSIMFLMMVVVGGAGTIWGALLGTAVFTSLPEYLRGLEDYEVLAYGGILMFILLFMPQGILERMQNLLNQMKQRVQKSP